MANSLPKYYETTLDNGLKIVAIPMDNGSNVITTNIIYKVGSRDEIMGKSGIAHMLEHMNFKSTDNLKAGEFDEIIKKFGGVNNASTSFDYTKYYIKSSSSNIDKSLELFSELMQNLALKDEEFQPERDVVAEERRWRTDNNPMGYLYFTLFNHIYVHHPYHWTPIGFMDDILNWSLDDIKDFHQTYYQPQNAIVLVAGDIDKDTVFEKTKKHFQDIKNTKDIPTLYIKEPKQNGARRITVHKESQVEMIAIAYRVGDFLDKDMVALSAIGELLSNGKSSKLHKTLVDEKRLVNTIYAYNMELRDPGVFLILAVCNSGIEATTVEKEILAVLEDLKSGNISDAELEKVKINTEADFVFSLDNSSSVADLFGGYFAKGDINPLLNYEQSIQDLTIQNLIDVAKKYFKESTSTTIILKKGNDDE
ncbi:M16 family metallopeptidase [Arcobacter sp. FWKO B]|uniref:M16 family metallopeptidase n=1 Tax=Arcobacter sp. FWKO B TaxID=2593672 RepID=UPI0018A695D0|nr:pitrilysin family protein [Arcobacter sp. FWKO B]QOG13327.1 insulinase family protein [Arcobacter sp. FWKO B]